MYGSSLFQGLPEDEQKGVVKAVSSTIAAVFNECEPECDVCYSEFSVAVGRKMDYLEALVENFKLGEEALKCQLPIGMAT